MSVGALNILKPAEIIRLRAVLNEVVLVLPKPQRTCETQALVAELLLQLAAGGEQDPVKLKDRALLTLRDGEPSLSRPKS
jgi:hypothetical protein